MMNQMDVIRSDRERMAYHEAGHVVLSFFGGRKIKSVAIDVYRITNKGINVGEGSYYEDVYRRLIDYQHDLAAKFAGAQAERIHRGGIYLHGIGDDLQSAIALHAEFVAECRAHGVKDPSTLEDAWETARRTLDSNWYLVEAIANRLLEKGWLPGRSVYKVIRSAAKNRQGKVSTGAVAFDNSQL